MKGIFGSSAEYLPASIVPPGFEGAAKPAEPILESKRYEVDRVGDSRLIDDHHDFWMHRNKVTMPNGKLTAIRQTNRKRMKAILQTLSYLLNHLKKKLFVNCPLLTSVPACTDRFVAAKAGNFS